MTRGTARERGSVALEAAILAPAFMLFCLLIFTGGRVALAQMAVQSAASEGARSASIARSAGEANGSATSAANSTLGNQGLACASQSVAVDTSGFGVPVGTDSMVSVTVTCVVDLSDLSVPGVPGTHTMSYQAFSPLDTHRGR